MKIKSELIAHRERPLTSRSDISLDEVRDITGGLNALAADVFSLRGYQICR